MFSSDTISADGVESPGEDMKLERHCRFYHEDGTIELLVENTMYKVHSYFLTRHSDWFRDRIENPREGEELSLPDGWEAVDGPDGAQVFVNYDLRETSFTRPIYPALPEAPAGVIPLPGTIREEFDRLLSIFYPEDLNLGDLSTQEAWESVLKLATRWSFAGLRARAVRELDALVSPFDRLVLAKEYDIEEWVEDALRGLCMRSEPLTCDEWTCMSAEDTEFVAEAREHARMADDQSWEDLSAKVDQHVAAWKARNSSRPTGEEISDASSASGDGSEQSEQPSNANIQSTISIKQTLLEGENNASDLPTAVNEQDVAEGTIEDRTGSCEANVADEAAPPIVSDNLVSEPEEIEVASPESSLAPDNALGEPQPMPIIAEDEEQEKGEVATTVAHPQASSAASAITITVTVPANTASVEATPLNETIPSTTESVETQPTEETEGSSTEVQRDAEGGETDEESVQVSHTTETTQSSGDDYEPLPSSPTTEISELSPTVITLEQQIHDAIDPPATPAVAEAPPIPQPSEEPSNAEPAPQGMNPATVDEQQLAQARAEKEKAEAEAKAKEDAIWADFERESKAREEALAREAEERARVATPPPRPTSPRTWTFSMSRASSSVAVPTKQSPRSSLGPSAPNGSPNPAPGFWNKLAGGAGMSPPIRPMSPPARTRTLSVASLPGASFFSSLAAPLATPATVNAQDSTAPAAVASVGS